MSLIRSNSGRSNPQWEKPPRLLYIPHSTEIYNIVEIFLDGNIVRFLKYFETYH